MGAYQPSAADPRQSNGVGRGEGSAIEIDAVVGSAATAAVEAATRSSERDRIGDNAAADIDAIFIASHAKRAGADLEKVAVEAAADIEAVVVRCAGAAIDISRQDSRGRQSAADVDAVVICTGAAAADAAELQNSAHHGECAAKVHAVVARTAGATAAV